MGGQTTQGALRFTQAGWLAPADGVLHVPTTRTVALEGPEPLAVVWHWTASRGKSAEHVKNLAVEVASGQLPPSALSSRTSRAVAPALAKAMSRHRQMRRMRAILGSRGREPREHTANPGAGRAAGRRAPSRIIDG